MLCQSCSKWVPDNSVFCNYCGNQVTSSSPPELQTWQQTPTSPQQSSNMWNSGTHQTAGNPPISSGNYPASSYPPPSHNAGFPPQDYQQGQGSLPEYLAQQAFPPPSSPFQRAFPSFPSPPAQPQSQTPPYTQLHAQGSGRGVSGAPPAPNRVQNLLIQLFQPSLAANPWLGVIIGGVGPAVLGALSFIILLSVLHGSQPTAGNLNSLNPLTFATINVIPTDSSIRDGLQALLVAQGVSRHIMGTTSSITGNIVFNVDLPSPLQLALLIPALFLMIGGYIAACTDMRNQVVASLWRGAAISLPYMLLLLLLATQVSGDIPSLQSSPTASSSIFSFLQNQVSATLSMNFGSLILLSLFWGVLFGLLGASFKLAQGHWRSWLHHILRNNTQYRLTGILAGALVTVLSGFLLALLLSYTAMAANMQLAQVSTCRAGGASGSLTSYDIASGPLIGVQLFAFSFGTPISFNLHASGALNSLLAASGCMGQTSFSLFGSQIHSSPWMYLLLLLPIISLLAGGRVSAYLGRPASIGAAGIQGALVAIPFTVMMMILAALSMISFSMDITGSVAILGNIPDMRLTASLGADVISVMVWSLLSGTFLGALGGIYQYSAASKNIDFILVQLGKALLVFAGPVCMLVDQLSARRSGASVRGRTLNILCGALTITLVLTVLAIATGAAFLVLSSIVTYDLNLKVHTIMNALFIALPGLLLLGALFSALFDNPQKANRFSSGQTSGGIV